MATRAARRMLIHVSNNYVVSGHRQFPAHIWHWFAALHHEGLIDQHSAEVTVWTCTPACRALRVLAEPQGLGVGSTQKQRAQWQNTKVWCPATATTRFKPNKRVFPHYCHHAATGHNLSLSGFWTEQNLASGQKSGVSSALKKTCWVGATDVGRDM